MNEVKVLSVEEEAQVNGGFPPIFYAVVAIAGHLARNPVVRMNCEQDWTGWCHILCRELGL